MIGRRGSSRPVRVLELRSVRGTGGGPEKTILQGAAASDPSRAQITVAYVRDSRDEVFHVDERARALGVDYVEVIERHSFDTSVPARLASIVTERRIDVIHSHEYKTDLLAWLVRRRGQVRFMATAHGWTGHTARERYLYYPVDKRLLSRFPLVLAVSGEIRRELLAHGASDERVRVLLNGIDHEMFRRDPARQQTARAERGLSGGDIVVGTVGRLEPQKRFDLLIDACAAIRTRVPSLCLLVAGEGSERASLERQIQQGGHGAWCRLLGHHHDVIGLHHALDVFVQSSAYEGTPNVVLEAMALETPIVATDVGGTAEICRPDLEGLIVPPGRAESLADAIAQMLEDRDAAAARVARARVRVETELSFATRVKTLEGIYEELMSCAMP